jgi:hypothetical protein
LGEAKDFFIKSIDTTGRKMTLSLSDKPKAIKEEKIETIALEEASPEITPEIIPEVPPEVPSEIK